MRNDFDNTEMCSFVPCQPFLVAIIDQTILTELNSERITWSDIQG